VEVVVGCGMVHLAQQAGAVAVLRVAVVVGVQ
jgi:hypothetical protein